MLKLNHLYLMDCMDGMRDFPDNYFDLAIVDPQYGLNEHGGVTRSGRVKQKNGSYLYVKDGQYKRKNWDTLPADKNYFNELFRISQRQIIWGCNYYDHQLGPGRIIWDKVNEKARQSDCEIAYNSMTKKVELIRYMWRGMMQGKSIKEGHIQQANKKLNEKRIHPTQKPVILYKELLKRYAQKSWKIIDTHAGSGSSIIAFIDFGCEWIAFEIDSDYHADATSRIKNYLLDLKIEFEL